MAKIKQTKETTMIYKILHGKPKIGKNEPTKDTVCIDVLKINLQIPSAL
jgi:hypothetical protein